MTFFQISLALSFSYITHAGLRNRSRHPLRSKSTQRRPANHQTRDGRRNTLRIQGVRLARGLLLPQGHEGRSYRWHAKINGYWTWVRRGMGEGSRQWMVVESSAQEVVYVSTISFAGLIIGWYYVGVYMGITATRGLEGRGQIIEIYIHNISGKAIYPIEARHGELPKFIWARARGKSII